MGSVLGLKSAKRCTGNRVGRADDESTEFVRTGEDHANFVLMSGLKRWCLDVSAWDGLEPNQWDFLLSLLPNSESSRIERFMRQNDRRLALGSRLLQRAIVSQVFGVEFSAADIGRTAENKPFFAGMTQALHDGTVSTELRNWNFNVSHHGPYVAIAAEPVCLCGVDVVDTIGNRGGEDDAAENYLRYFTDHFTDEEWAAIRRTADDEGRLRRFFLNWGFKESYVKAIGQGLGYDLRRISFVEGDWLNCMDGPCYCDCFLEDRRGAQTPDGNDSCGSGDGSDRHRCCSCEMTIAEDKTIVCYPENPKNVGRMAASVDGSGKGVGMVEKQSRLRDIGYHRCFCTCRMRVATVRVDGKLRTDWAFRVFPLADGYAACVARGPPSECSESGRAAGVVSDGSVGTGGSGLGMKQGLNLPQIGFRTVHLTDILPAAALADFQSLSSMSN